jgi:YebC/PmpR family DNA-binding regulatory protein
MAGHNKWSQIKRKKAITDNRRASVWTKTIREITVAAKAGGGDPGMNPRLRLAIDTAKSQNMPNENVERAIKKGTGELEGASYDEVTYEGYGPGGSAIYIEGSTDNPNRTVADVRYVFSRNAGNMGASGSVAWMFDRKGHLILEADGGDEEQLMEVALECGAEDFSADDGHFVVSTAVLDFHAVSLALEAKGIKIDTAELAMVPKNLVKVEGDDAVQLVKLIEKLEELDDVSKVFTNADIDAAALGDD